MPPLKNLRQEEFCLRYWKSRNRIASYRGAGYIARTDNTASVMAHHLLKNANVQARLLELQREAAARAEITEARVMRELGRVAFSDLRDYYAENGTMKPTHEWSTQQARAVAAIEVEETFAGKGKDRVWTGYVKRVKLWDKMVALNMLAKHFKIVDADRFPSWPPGSNITVNFYLPEKRPHVLNGHGTEPSSNGHGG